MTEHAELLELAREFAQGELAPDEATRDAAGALPDALFATLGEMGFLGMAVPESAGGLGLDPATYHEVLAILAEADPAAAMVVAEHGAAAVTLAEAGGAGVEALAMGEVLATTAVLEGGADETTDLPATAFDGDSVTGAKRMVANGARASRLLVVARSGEDTVVVAVDGDAATPGERTTTMGLSALELVDLELEGAGEALPGEGPARQLAARRRTGIAAVGVGVARSALAHAIRYSEERAQFGRNLSGFDAIQAKLADMTARTAAAEALVRDVSGALGAGTTITGRAAAAKIVATETAMFTADEAVQIYGGYGYMRDYPVEKRMRDAKGLEVLGGTNEALRRVVTRELLAAARGA